MALLQFTSGEGKSARLLDRHTRGLARHCLREPSGRHVCAVCSGRIQHNHDCKHQYISATSEPSGKVRAGPYASLPHDVVDRTLRGSKDGRAFVQPGLQTNPECSEVCKGGSSGRICLIRPHTSIAYTSRAVCVTDWDRRQKEKCTYSRT